MNRLQKAITVCGITATVNVLGLLASIDPNGTFFSIATAQAGQTAEEKVLESFFKVEDIPLEGG